ncbi:amidohydrolase family protein [Mycobacterium sp.]|uniref:amidohydrolase family protein n=1 Tax=Mycobacterium sp. TaxID=1785 RepID=UPI003D14BBDD
MDGSDDTGCRIDFHAHVVVELPNFAERFGDLRWPTFSTADGTGRLSRNGQVVRTMSSSAWSTARRLDDMDGTGLDRQVLSPVPPLICDWGDARQATEWADQLNAGIAQVVADHPGRFSGLGAVPLHYPDKAVDVLQRARDAGLSGVEIGTTAGDRELDHADLQEFFDAAEQLDMIVFVHPLILETGAGWSQRITGLANSFGLGMTTDTAIAASRLVFGGHVVRCPQLRICLAHGGGTFFWALSRIARLWDQGDGPRSSDLTRNVFVDSVVYDQANLRYLCDRIGSDRILFGTDYPLPAQDDLGGSILADLPAADAAKIAGLNAAALLGVPTTSH